VFKHEQENFMTHAYELQALTDVWTGDAGTAQSKQANRLLPTGLLGSIRWWFEVLVRGLGGAPCDPSTNQKACLNEQHCVVCELFGCTGWARKFHFDVRNAQGAILTSKLTKGTKFHLRFTPLRAVKADEWTLLELTLRLISDFGALGGKTVLKPSNQNNKAQHADFGLVKLVNTPTITHTREQLASYVSTWTKKPSVNGAAWASCSNMWFVDGKHLTRQNQNTSTFNRVIGRPEPKNESANGDSWLAGRRAQGARNGRPAVEAESKKVFSFQSPPRTFGFVQRTSEFEATREKLRGVWSLPAIPTDWFLSGDALMARLLGNSGASP
jgi:CRISPR-associated protein Cmr1